MSSIILKCRCEHAYQDAVYGPGNRVHNDKKGAKLVGRKSRCTVCGDVKDVKGGNEDAK